jgi:hypothetical protein
VSPTTSGAAGLCAERNPYPIHLKRVDVTGNLLDLKAAFGAEKPECSQYAKYSQRNTFVAEGWQAPTFTLGLASASGSCGRELAGIKMISLDTRVGAGRTLAMSSKVARFLRCGHWRFSPLVLK